MTVGPTFSYCNYIRVNAIYPGFKMIELPDKTTSITIISNLKKLLKLNKNYKLATRNND